MSQTINLKKFIHSQTYFYKSPIFQENKDYINKRFIPRTKNSHRILLNYKTTNNFMKKNNIIINSKSQNNILTPANKESYYKTNTNFISNTPVNHKISNFRFNKAPTLKQNQIEINKIITKKKIQKNKEFSNLYNNILINESRTFRNNLYITGCGLLSKKSKKIRRNKSFNELIPKQNNSINEINNSSGNTNLNKNEFNNNYSNNIFDKEERIINKSINFRDMNKSRNNSTSNLLPTLLNTSKKNNIILLLNPLVKMRMMVNEVIFSEMESVKQFSENENKLIKFRVFQNLKNKEIKNMNKKDDFDLENKINKLLELKNIFEINYIKQRYF